MIAYSVTISMLSVNDLGQWVVCQLGHKMKMFAAF